MLRNYRLETFTLKIDQDIFEQVQYVLESFYSIFITFNPC